MTLNPSQRAAIRIEALSWLRTPYHHGARVKHAGVDCLQLLCAVYEACGLVPHIETPHYAQDIMLHAGTETYLAGLEQYAQPTDNPQLGDVAIWKFGRIFSHAGILLEDGQVVHALVSEGRVIVSRISEPPLIGRAVRYYTLGV